MHLESIWSIITGLIYSQTVEEDVKNGVNKLPIPILSGALMPSSPLTNPLMLRTSSVGTMARVFLGATLGIQISVSSIVGHKSVEVFRGRIQRGGNRGSGPPGKSQQAIVGLFRNSGTEPTQKGVQLSRRRSLRMATGA